MEVMAKLPVSPALHELLTKQPVIKYPKGQVIETTDGVKRFYLVKSGYVKRYLISNDGELGVQVIYGPGDVLPLTLVFKALFEHDINDGPETYYYETMADTELYGIDLASLLAAIETNNLLYRGLFREAGRRMESTLQGLENLRMKTSYNRVAHQLVYLAKQFGQKTAAGIKISVPLTHQDIADVLGVTRETVSSSMTRLRKKGLVKNSRGIIIPDLDKLEAEAHR